jgi:type III protein arginine methyltransferase
MAPKQLSSMQKFAMQQQQEDKKAAAATAAAASKKAQGASAAAAKKNIGFLPPGYVPPMSKAAAAQQRKDSFEFQFDEHFFVPQRIAKAPSALVEAVNDFHYAMMNDHPRNRFYYELLKKHVTPETGVLEIGAGSGLLSMMAAQLGAKWVVAVEGSNEMCRLAQENVKANNLQDKIKIMNMLSTDLSPKHLPERPHILVSEIFGTLLLGESALDYIQDVRERVLRPDTVIIPQMGIQYGVLIECPVLESICSVSSWNGLNLSRVNSLKDTASCVFTKKYGFRMSSVPFKRLCEPIKILDIDFAKTKQGFTELEREFRVKALDDGVAHAILYFWSAFQTPTGDIMSTAPWDTVDNFPRDMQWGQALQLIDSGGDTSEPTPLTVKRDEEYRFVCCTSDDHVIVQLNYVPGEDDRHVDPLADLEEVNLDDDEEAEAAGVSKEEDESKQ